MLKNVNSQHFNCLKKPESRPQSIQDEEATVNLTPDMPRVEGTT